MESSFTKSWYDKKKLCKIDKIQHVENRQFKDNYNMPKLTIKAICYRRTLGPIIILEKLRY